MLWPRKPSLVVLVVCVGCWVLPSVALATTTHYPFWTFTSKNGAVLPPGDSSTVSFSLQTSYNGKNTPIAGGTYLVHPGDSAQTMATNLAEQLNASTQNAYWQFTVVQDAKVPSRWNVQGTPAAGLAATPKAIYVRSAVGTSATSVSGVKASAGVDPLLGTAEYLLTGTAVGDGTVSLGIEGLTFTTATYDLGNGQPLTALQIEQNLLALLHAGGYSQALLDMGTGILSIPYISTGDPAAGDGSDIGALLSNDGDTGNLVTMAAITVPEPTTIVLAALGALGLLEFRRRAKATVLSQQHSGHQGATRRP